MVNPSLLENDIRSSYDLLSRLISPSVAHRRFVARAVGEKSSSFLLSCATYETPLSPPIVDKQRKAVQAMMSQTHRCLNVVNQSQLTANFHWIVSRLPTTPNLMDCLRQKPLTAFDQVEWVIVAVAETLTSAVKKGCPRFTLESHQLHVDFDTRSLTLLPPDLPLFGAGSLAEEDALMTRAGPVDFQLSALDPIPTNDREYVTPLAALCCQMLGQTLNPGAGQNERFRSFAALSSSQNTLLRSALAGTDRHRFGSLEEFVSSLTGISRPQTTGVLSTSPTTANDAHQTAELENFRKVSNRPDEDQEPSLQERKSTSLPPPLPESHRGIQATAVPPPLPVESNSPDPVAISSLRIAALFKNRDVKPVHRLRLASEDRNQTLLAIVAGARLTMGRSATRDLVTQFRPRNTMNDSRTLAISRLQCEALHEDEKFILRHPDSANPNIRKGMAVVDKEAIKLPHTVTLAGEYSVEFRPLASAYPCGYPSVEGWSQKEVEKPKGACWVKPLDSNALRMEVGWILSDISLAATPSGGITFSDPTDGDGVGRIHHHDGIFWWEAVDAENAKLNGENLCPGELVPLQAGDRLLLGMASFLLQSCEED